MFDHHLIKNYQIYSLEKLNSTELYTIQILNKNAIPTCQTYYKTLLEGSDLEWKNIYKLPRLITVDNSMRVFQYKILNNVLFLNKKLFLFSKSDTSLCSFCHREDETVQHLFVFCDVVKKLWTKLQRDFSHECSFEIPFLNPQSAIFGFFNTDNEDHVLLNHILLLFKHFVYTARMNGNLSFPSLQRKINKVYKTEYSIALSDIRKKERFLKKWNPIKSRLENL